MDVMVCKCMHSVISLDSYQFTSLLTRHMVPSFSKILVSIYLFISLIVDILFQVCPEGKQIIAGEKI
jgi:hypothetical protein